MPTGGGLDPVVQPFDADITRYIAKIGEMRTAYTALVGEVKPIRIDADISGALRGIADVKAALAGLPDSKTIRISVDGGGGDAAAMIRELRDISASMDMVTSSMGRMEDHLTVISKNVQDSSADLMMQTQMLRDNAEAHNRAATAVAALAAARGRAGGGGGGAALAAAAGAAAGGGGGGGGGFVPWAGGGWQAVRFWGMMGAEVASTVVPALVAAGSAALVGAQGFEQLQNRAQALYTVNEALGKSLGTTAGQFVLGPGGNALQNAQNLYGGGVYGLAGAGMNILRSGAGAGFLQMGGQTLSMLDRAAASAVLNATQGHTGQKLMGALGGGTGYLREFGDVGANLGNLLLNVAPFLPGVGSDLLGTLSGATGALAAGTGFLGKNFPPALTGFFAYEAASRWGPGILGGKGLIGRMLGLRGVGGLGGLIGKIPGLGGLGEGLAGLGGPEIAIPAVIAALAMEAARVKTPAQALVSGLQGDVAAGGFTGAWQPLAHELTITSALSAATTPPGVDYAAGGTTARAYAAATGRMLRGAPTAHQVYTQAAATAAQQMGELVAAGPQLVGALSQVGIKGMSLADSFQAAQNALLDIPHSFGPGGKLNAQALQQLRDFATTIGPMTQSGGAFGAAVAGTQIMGSTQMKNLATVNQAMDSMTQIMSAGPAGMAALAAMQQGAPSGMAGALTSFTSPAGASAWTSFASTSQPSIISQMQQFNDQMRTALTLGALNQGQAAGLTGFQMQQFLPMARQSPAALAMLMQQGAQMGVTGYYDPSKSQAQNYAAAVSATKAIADNQRQAARDTNTMVERLSNLPATAQKLVMGTDAQIQAQQIARAAQDAMNIKGGINVKLNAADLVGQLKAAGVQGAAALRQSLDAILTQAGVSKGMRLKIEGEINWKNVVPPPPHPVAYGTIIYTTSIQGLGSVRTVSGSGSLGSLGGHTGQTGMRVPGYGGGDIFPALLEPGEAVVPKHLVSAVAPFLSAHGVPGFAGGGIAGLLGLPIAQAAGFASEGGILGLMPAAARKIIEALITSLGSETAPFRQFGQELLHGLMEGIKSAPHETAKMATTLANKVITEVNFAKNTSAAMVQGLNLAGMTQLSGTAPLTMDQQILAGGGTLTVQQQMGDYLASLTSFRGDFGKLAKGGLNKALLQQILGAGPVQGDALAQSILGGAGGVGAANKIYGQITQQSNLLGISAAGAVYGQPRTTAVNVTVNVAGGKGLALTEADIKKIVEELQAKLLQQARRNPKTGLQLSGRGV